MLALLSSFDPLIIRSGCALSVTSRRVSVGDLSCPLQARRAGSCLCGAFRADGFLSSLEYFSSS